jgi:hypothetical protein
MPDAPHRRADTLKRRSEHREQARNNAPTGVKWQFTTANARIKLRSLYPSVEG